MWTIGRSWLILMLIDGLPIQMPRRFLLLIVLFTVIFTYSFLKYATFVDLSKTSVKLSSVSERIPLTKIYNRSNVSQKKQVLIWTGTFPGEFIGFHFNELNCSKSINYELTTDRQLFHRSNYVIFYSRDLQKGRYGMHDMPNYKPFGQTWIFWSMEAPSNSGINN